MTASEELPFMSPKSCQHSFAPTGGAVVCVFCDWQPDLDNLSCYLNTGLWFDEFKRQRGDWFSVIEAPARGTPVRIRGPEFEETVATWGHPDSILDRWFVHPQGILLDFKVTHWRPI